MVSPNSFRLLTYAALAVICGAVISNAALSLGISYTNIAPPGSGSFGTLEKFKSAAELKVFLESHSSRMYYLEDTILFRWSTPSAATKADSSIAMTMAGQAVNDYSSTNIQVAGVDEADQVKTDGKYIYVSRNRTVYIVLATPAKESKLISKIEFKEEIGDIYIAGDKLVVFGRGEPVYAPMPKAPGIMPPIPRPNTVNVRVYDVIDRASPKLEREFKAEGGYLASRMIGDYVYLVAQRGAWLYEGKISLPTIYEGSASREINPNEIYYVNGTDPWYAYTLIISFNAQKPSLPISQETFLIGSSGTVYVSLKHLYLTVGGYTNTKIHKFSLGEGKVSHVAEGEIPGWVLNQFSMDENNGYFRVATTSGRVSRSGTQSSSNNVYVLDEAMKIVGELEDLAPGEQIYSARFMGERCYLVTFKKVDPLFVIDLHDPSNPTVLGKLKIPGYSNYLHPYDDKHVIGIGKETVEAKEGDFAWYQGIKISLFDVSDVSNPRELAKMEVGDRGSDSPALYDHKAFLFSKDRGLLVLPILEAKINPATYGGKPPSNAYGDFVYQGAYVFKIGLDGIELRGRITHLKDGELLKSGYMFDSEYTVERSLYIGQSLYTVSGRMVKANSLVNLSEIATVILK